jgi:hypothetical protein
MTAKLGGWLMVRGAGSSVGGPLAGRLQTGASNRLK